MRIKIFSSPSFHIKDLSQNTKQFKYFAGIFFNQIHFIRCMNILITIVSKIVVGYIIYIVL
jgi:hypothetical protein